MSKAFLICPVRNTTEDWTEYVAELEKQGWEVHYPPRDTKQDDPVGLDICHQNREAIESAQAVFIIWDGQSTGSLFDLGMAFALQKPLQIIKIPEPTQGKSFQNMMQAWANESLG